MRYGTFCACARFHYGEKINALGRETNNTDECNVWLCKKGDREVWRMAALDKAEQFTGMGWHGTAHSSLHSGFKHLTMLVERLSHTILLLNE